MGWLGLGLKAAKTIKGVKPFAQTGGKTVKQWKSQVRHKKRMDSIREVGDKITGNLKKSAKKLQELNETLKKQNKILDD